MINYNFGQRLALGFSLLGGVCLLSGCITNTPAPAASPASTTTESTTTAPPVMAPPATSSTTTTTQSTQ